MAYRLFSTPRNIFYGAGSIEALATLPTQRALIVTDPGVRAQGIVERVDNILRKNKTEVAVYDGVEPDSSMNIVSGIFSLAQDFRPDLFIGLGGGSSIDSGKAGWVLYEHPDLAGYSLREAVPEVRRRPLHQKAKYAAVPTTSGTGSEATGGAVIADRDAKPPFKVTWASEQIVPDVAVLDPALAASMPPGVTANTGFDALVHAIECYVFNPVTGPVHSLAVGAARTVYAWLPKAVANGKDMAAREQMHLAALQGGMVVNNARSGLVHGTAHQLGILSNIPHGLACAFTVCPVFAFLYPTHRERLISLATALGIDAKDDRNKVAKLLDSLDALKKEVGIPLAIKGTDLDEGTFMEKLDPMAESYVENMAPTVAKISEDARRGRGIPLSASEVKEILMHAWNGTRAELG